MNPERNEPGWQPGYNFLRLNIAERGAIAYLDVEAEGEFGKLRMASAQCSRIPSARKSTGTASG